MSLESSQLWLLIPRKFTDVMVLLSHAEGQDFWQRIGRDGGFSA